MTYIFTQNVTLPQVFFRHFASKNQLPGFCISGALVENGLTSKMGQIELNCWIGIEQKTTKHQLVITIHQTGNFKMVGNFKTMPL